MGLSRLGPERPTTAGLLYQNRPLLRSKRSAIGVRHTYGKSVALTVSISIAAVAPDAGISDPGAQEAALPNARNGPIANAQREGLLQPVQLLWGKRNPVVAQVDRPQLAFDDVVAERNAG